MALQWMTPREAYETDVAAAAAEMAVDAIEESAAVAQLAVREAETAVARAYDVLYKIEIDTIRVDTARIQVETEHLAHAVTTRGKFFAETMTALLSFSALLAQNDVIYAIVPAVGAAFWATIAWRTWGDLKRLRAVIEADGSLR